MGVEEISKISFRNCIQ